MTIIGTADRPGLAPFGEPTVCVSSAAPGNRIAVGIDGSEVARHALQWALEEARRRHVGCRVIEVWSPGAIDRLDRWTKDHLLEERLADEQTSLSSLVDDALAEIGGVRTADVDLQVGDPVEILTEAAQHADLLVVGSRGRYGLTSLVPGSVSSALIHRRICPIVVVPPHADTGARHHRVVVGVDGSDEAVRALAWAAEEARVRDEELVVVHAWQVPVVVMSPYMPTVVVPSEDCLHAGEEILERAVRGIEPVVGLRIVPQLVEGSADLQLVRAAATADLLVVGSRGRAGLAAAVLGSTSHGCLRHSPCAVAVIP